MDDFWDAWSEEAEPGLFRAYCRSGGQVASGIRRALGSMGYLQVGGKLFIGIGVRSAVRARVDRCALWSLGFIRVLLTCGFKKSVFDTLEDLNYFVKQVVVMRRDSGLHRWAGWLREDLGARPYAWLRSDFVPLLPISGSPR